MKSMTIGIAAAQAGVGVETVRFYERKGLIQKPAKPLGGGYRHYSREIVQRIRFVRGAQELGFSLREIDVLLNLRADPGSDCGAVQTRASKKLREVEGRIGRLEKIGDALRKVIAACPSQGGLQDCTIVAALENEADRISRQGRIQGLDTVP